MQFLPINLRQDLSVANGDIELLRSRVDNTNIRATLALS